MRHLTYFLLIMLLVIGSCTKEKQSPPPELIGYWQWEITHQGLPIYDLTPENTGIEKIILLTEDFGWKKFENDSIVGSGTFSIGHGTYSPSVYKTWIYDSIVFHNPGKTIPTNWDYYEIEADTLTFCCCFRGYAGCYKTEYIKH